MKRDCLLSKAYSGPPMILAGVTLFYSPLANEILRELNTAFFMGDGTGDQTMHHGVCEGVFVMFLIASSDFKRLDEIRKMDRKERHALVLSFMIEHADEMDELRDQVIERVEASIAASVESEVVGKPLAQAQES